MSRQVKLVRIFLIVSIMAELAKSLHCCTYFLTELSVNLPYAMLSLVGTVIPCTVTNEKPTLLTLALFSFLYIAPAASVLW